LHLQSWGGRTRTSNFQSRASHPFCSAPSETRRYAMPRTPVRRPRRAKPTPKPSPNRHRVPHRRRTPDGRGREDRDGERCTHV